MKLVIEAPLGIGFGDLEIFISRHNQICYFGGRLTNYNDFMRKKAQ